MKLAERIREYFNAPAKSPERTSTDGECEHYHEFKADTQGNGKTTFTIGENCPDHFHKIKNWDVMPAGKDGHTHTIEIDERGKVGIAEPDFKTIYGLEHWLKKMGTKASDFKGKVRVAGKTYDSIKDAMKDYGKRILQ